MNYNEFRKTYNWTLKHYSGTHELYNSDFYGLLLGHVTIRKYEKRGTRWYLVSESREDVTPAYYFNTVDAIPFFKALGGSERVSCGYCVRGYVPLEISSISPDKTMKTVREFKLF